MGKKEKNPLIFALSNYFRLVVKYFNESRNSGQRKQSHSHHCFKTQNEIIIYQLITIHD